MKHHDLSQVLPRALGRCQLPGKLYLAGDLQLSDVVVLLLELSDTVLLLLCLLDL